MPRANSIDDSGERVTVLNEAAFVGWPVATDWRIRVLCERLELIADPLRWMYGHRVD